MLSYLLPYRGKLQALVSAGTWSAFTTTHPEGQATELYRLDSSAEQPILYRDPLTCGATSLLLDKDTLWLAGSDGKLYSASLSKGKPKALKGLSVGTNPVLAMATLAGNKLAVLQAQQLQIIDLKQATIVQHFALDNPASTLSAHYEGLWLVVGDDSGVVSVYQSECADRPFQLVSQAQLHQGAVTALQFAQHELSFYSAGRDRKLLYTHARGTLQPLDKGRSSNHEAAITAIHLGQERFFTGSLDKTVKAWAYAGGQPVTFKQNLPQVTAMSTALYQDKPVLIIAGDHNRLAFLKLTPNEKFAELAFVVHDGYQLAQHLQKSTHPQEREQALSLLAAYDDQQALKLLIAHLDKEQDKSLREKIIQIAAKAKHARAIDLLETALKDKRHESVRQQAFTALVARAKANDLRPYELALNSQHLDIGTEALQQLSKYAHQQTRAEQLLIQALQHKRAPLRSLALSLLEQHYSQHSPKASLQALATPYPDLQRAALIRLYQRDLLDEIEVKQAILLAQSHTDASLRHTAFLVSILSRKPLTEALKALEPELARQLQELQDFELLGNSKASQSSKKSASASDTAITKLKKAVKTDTAKPAKNLQIEDYQPLLQGMSNQHADISFTAALALSVLQDQRAFGLLLLLSQEQDEAIRAGVCHAFARLGQIESLPTLEILLNDNAATVRDAAFNTLQNLQADDLLSAQKGFASQQADIHARSLKVLLDYFSSHTAQHEPALLQLKAALNDPFTRVRHEAMKASLNRQLGGSERATLQLLLNSRFEDVHHEVLNELMAKSRLLPRVDWVEPDLLALLNDDFASIRQAAMQFALQEHKRFDTLHILEKASQSPYLDRREAVLEHIQKHPAQSKQDFIQNLVNDENEALRNKALALLMSGNRRDELKAALHSPHDDVQVMVASALAAWGDEEVYGVLEALLARDEPHNKHELAHWKRIAEAALKGLARLGDPRSFATIQRFLKHNDKELLKAAATALPWISTTDQLAELQALQADERQPVRAHASFALALQGKPEGRLLFQQVELLSQIESPFQMAAAICLEGATPLSLQSALLEKSTATSALLTLLLHDCLLHGDEPHLSTWALSVPSPTVQIVCADFLVRYAEPQARWLYLCDWLAEHHHAKRSKKDKEPRWTISTATLQNIATVLVYGNGQAKARLLQLLHDFDQGQALPVWELHYSAFQEWYSDAIHLAQQSAQQHPPKTPKASQASWHQRALGAYLGLVRQGNRYSLSALTRLYQLGEQNSELRHSISSSLLTLLNHPQVDFRDYAFEKLQCLDMDLATLGQIATTSPHTDIARKGLQLLVENYPLQQSHQLLQSMIKREHSLLAEEAWKLYKQDVGLYTAAPFALESFTLRLRESCVRELAAQFKDEPAQNLLLQAAGNDHINTRLSAVKTLASHQHPQALPCLMQLLQQEDNEKQQLAIIKTMCLLEDKQTARELLDYREQHSLSEPVIRAIYAAIAAYRDTTLAPRLFKLLEQKPEESKLLQNALLMLSAYDQDIKDYEEKQADCSWLDKQYPRHDALLIELFQHLLKLNYHAEAAKLCRSLAWAKDEAAGTALEAAVKVIDSKHLAAVVNALVYRLEKRQGRAATLLELLSHKDSEIQFLAAEGLANNAHQQGFSILFAALDYNDNDAYRQRAVLALGKSGDERALDKLLKLAEDKEHFLHDVAIEALGHLGKSKSADRILQLLKSNLKQADSYSTVVKHSLNGLRWFNTLDAWQVIYQYIKEHKDPYDYYGNLEHAIGLLQYHDTPATYELLYKLLSQDEQFDTVKAAYHTARLLLKADDTQSCAADYAAVQGYYPVQLDDQILPRIARSAPSADIIRLVQADFKNTSIVLRDLGNALMNREDYQAADLLDLLASQRTEVVGLAARLLTRQHKLNKAAQSALQKALEQAYLHWQLKYRDWHDQPYDTALEERQAAWQNSETTLKQLLWACVRHALQNTRLLDLLSTQQKHERPLQVHMLKALLTQNQLAPALLNAVDGLQSDSVPEVSTLAAQILAKQGCQQTPDWKHFLSQPHTLLNERFAQSLADAAADSAYQAQVLPLLIARQDINTLQTIATDHLQQEALRLGAIEGLARILNAEAAHALQMIRQNSDETEGVIARAAYRALRRQQRSQAKQAKPVAARGAAA